MALGRNRSLRGRFLTLTSFIRRNLSIPKEPRYPAMYKISLSLAKFCGYNDTIKCVHWHPPRFSFQNVPSHLYILGGGSVSSRTRYHGDTHSPREPRVGCLTIPYRARLWTVLSWWFLLPACRLGRWRNIRSTTDLTCWVVQSTVQGIQTSLRAACSARALEGVSRVEDEGHDRDLLCHANAFFNVQTLIEIVCIIFSLVVAVAVAVAVAVVASSEKCRSYLTTLRTNQYGVSINPARILYADK